MAQVSNQSTSPIELKELVKARNTVHHRLMSLPPAQHASGETNATISECCRLTALLYSHCVTFPIQPGCAGVAHPIKELHRAHVQLEQQVTTHSAEVEALRLWSLLVCCIATLSTPRGDAFKTLLGAVLHRYDSIQSLDHLLEIVRDFIWSDCAARSGAEVVWGELLRAQTESAYGDGG